MCWVGHILSYWWPADAAQVAVDISCSLQFICIFVSSLIFLSLSSLAFLSVQIVLNSIKNAFLQDIEPGK